MRSILLFIFVVRLNLMRELPTLYYIILIFKKYKTFSVLIYSYINTSGNWKNEKLCGNTTPAGRTDLNYWIKHPFEFSDPILKPEYL